MMVVRQQQRARQIDGQPQPRHPQRLAIGNRAGRQQPVDRFDRNADREHAEQQGAGKARQIADFAGPEHEARIGGMAARIAIGERRQPERADMGSHVDAIGQQRHRPGRQPRCNLDQHRDRGQRDHPQRPAFMGVMASTQRRDRAVLGPRAHDRSIPSSAARTRGASSGVQISRSGSSVSAPL